MPRQPKHISDEQRRSVLRLIFRGEQAHLVSKKVGLSKHLVKRIVDDFAASAEEENSVLDAAVKIGIRDEVNALIELSGQVAKTRYEAAECAKGAKLLAKLHGIKVEHAYLDEFLDEFMKRGGEQGLSPAVLAGHAVEYGKLCGETGKTLRKVVEEYGSKSSSVKDLEDSLRDLESRRAEAHRALGAELKEAKTSREEVKWFGEVRAALLQDGVDIRELDGLRNILANVAEKGADPGALVEVCTKHRSVSEEVEKLEGRMGELERVISERKSTSSRLESEIEKMGALRDSLKHLEMRHVGAGLVEAIADGVNDASARLGITTVEAIEELRRDIDEYYEETYGLRGEASRLSTRRDGLIEDIKVLNERKISLVSVTGAKQGSLDSLERLRLGGVPEESLVEWGKIVAAQGFDASSFGREVESLGGLKAYVEEKTKSRRELDETLRALEGSIDDRRRHLAELSVSTDLACDQLKITTGEVEKARHSLVKEVSNLQRSIKQIASEAQSAGEAIGRYRDLNVIMLMMSGVEVNVGEGKVATLGLLSVVSRYLQRAGYSRTYRKLDEALETYRGELSNV